MPDVPPYRRVIRPGGSAKLEVSAPCLYPTLFKRLAWVPLNPLADPEERRALFVESMARAMALAGIELIWRELAVAHQISVFVH